MVQLRHFSLTGEVPFPFEQHHQQQHSPYADSLSQYDTRCLRDDGYNGTPVWKRHLPYRRLNENASVAQHNHPISYNYPQRRFSNEERSRLDWPAECSKQF